MTCYAHQISYVMLYTICVLEKWDINYKNKRVKPVNVNCIAISPLLDVQLRSLIH